MSHLTFTTLCALLLALAFAAVENRTPRERVYVAVRVFLCSMFGVVAGSWTMLLIHG